MKRVLLTCLLFIMIGNIFSQDLKRAKSDLDSKQFDKAKTEIDAFMDKNPTNAEGLYLKSKIYGSLASSDQFSSLDPDARTKAFEAFKKAEDAKDAKVTLAMVQDQYKPVFNLYTGYYEAGIKDFNSGATNKSKPDFEKALNDFKNANMVGNYIYSNKWALSDLDTSLVLNIGKAALNAGNDEEALTYFKKLADANITSTSETKEGYDLPYQWLTLHYKQQKDEDNLIKYANLGMKFYPNEDYFDAVMLDYYRDKKDNDALFKKYSEIVAKYPDSLSYHFNYANEAFNYLYLSDAGVKINNKDSLLQTIYTELQKSIALKPDDINTNWLFAQYYYNSGIDSRDKGLAIKNAKPIDAKTKADLNMQSKESFNKAIPYGEKALSLLENGFQKSEKSRYKSVTDLMQRIYESLQQADKVKVYQGKYDAADAKFIN